MSKLYGNQHIFEPGLSLEQASLHRKAVNLSRAHRNLEAEIINVLLEVENSKLYKVLNFTSLFTYSMGALGFSEAVSYSFISVMRRAREIPDLRKAISQCEVSVSKIQRVMPVINSQNAKELIEFAKTHSNREIEREVARRNPKTAPKEREVYLNEKVVQVTVSLTVEDYKKLKKAQNLESQRTSKAYSISDTLGELLDFYLQRKDPVQKACRAQQRAEKTEKTKRPEKFKSAISGAKATTSTTSKLAIPRSPTPWRESEGFAEPGIPDKFLPGEVRSLRVPLTAEQKHAVTRRDGGQCAHIDIQNRRCQNQRWLEIHHLRPVGKGGGNNLSNLLTLCSQHHDLVHQYSLPLEGQVSWIRSPAHTYQSYSKSLVR